MDEQQNPPMQQPETPVSSQSAPVGEAKSGSGLDPKIAAALCWALYPISSIVFILIEKEDRYVRFHAYQSLFFGIAVIVASIISSILVVILIGIILGPLVMIGGLIIWVLGMVKAYNGETWKLPIIGDMAEEYANK